MRFLLAFAAIGLLQTTAHADPAEAMQRLASLAGEFRVEGIRHTADGPVDLVPTSATVEYTLNDLALVERSDTDLGREEPVGLMTVFGYDTYREVYRISVIDDTWGVPDIYEGRFVSDGVLIATNLRSDTHFPLEGGGRLHFQLRWDLSGDVKRFDVLMSGDGGASWQPYFETTYTRILAED